nr:transcription initiation factor tfiid subunit 8 [Ipomoea batatas]
MEANWGVKESERILWILGVQYLRIAVAQICESVGFERFNESALDSFADIAIKYLFDLGKTGTSYANLAGRSECNVFDIVRALEDLRRFLSPSQCHTFQWSKFLG